VSSVGQGVDPAWLGREIVSSGMAGGAYSECVVVAVDDLIPVPEGPALTDAAALLRDGRTAVSLIEQADFRADEWVLVLVAGGGLGSLLVQLAHNAGTHVIGGADGRRKRELARELGADVVVDYAPPEWARPGLAAANGAGAALLVGRCKVLHHILPSSILIAWLTTGTSTAGQVSSS
jgi:NADPH:quinone reductase